MCVCKCSKIDLFQCTKYCQVVTKFSVKIYRTLVCLIFATLWLQAYHYTCTGSVERVILMKEHPVYDNFLDKSSNITLSQLSSLKLEERIYVPYIVYFSSLPSLLLKMQEKPHFPWQVQTNHIPIYCPVTLVFLVPTPVQEPVCGQSRTLRASLPPCCTRDTSTTPVIQTTPGWRQKFGTFIMTLEITLSLGCQR